MSVKTWLATTRHGLVHATCDAHERWSVAALLTDQMVTCLAADPLNRAVVYAGTQGNGVLRSADGGQTWHPAGLAGAQCHPLSSLAFLPEQTVFHYLMHVQYTLTQIPLVVILLRQTRCSANSKGWSDAKAHRLCNESIEE